MIYLINLMGMIMLRYFGHDSVSATAKNYPTNIIPNFHAGHDSDSVAVYRLERYLLGTGPYWSHPSQGGPHWLWQAEQIFDGQFYDTVAFSLHPDIPKSQWEWGSVNIDQGFEWFKYEIGPLEWDSLATRLGDSIHSSHYYPLPARFAYYDFEESENNENVTIDAFPNPATDVATLKLNQHCKADNIYCKCYDVTGKEVTNYFNFEYNGCSISLSNINSYKGMLLCIVYSNGIMQGSTKIILQ